MTFKPVISDDPMYLLLKDHRVADFNRGRAAGEAAVLAGCDLSNLDLRGLEAEGLDLRDACLDHADLRGVDFSGADLSGATLHAALLAGVLFRDDLSPEEIALSLEHGTRLRQRRPGGSD